MAKAKDPKPRPEAAGKARRRIDWEAIERDYRTGKFSLRELEKKHSAGYSDISKRAKKEGWTQDLRAAVKQATNAALIQEITQQAATEAQQSTTAVVLAAAEVNKQVILAHRGDVAAARSVTLAMLEELRTTTMDRDQLAEMFLAMTRDMDPIERTVFNSNVASLMKLHSRVGSMHKLADTFAKLQAMERTAFGLDEEGSKHNEKPDPIDWESIPPADRQAAFMRLIGA